VIEDELRTLLAERAGTAGEHPGRVAQVRSRVRRTRRRRAAGAALGLALLAGTGIGLTRLPDPATTLPAGAPAGPYFAADGRPESVAGYRGSSYFAFSGDAAWSASINFTALSHVVVARCDHPGDLGLSGLGGQLRLSCRTPVEGHYEGALTVVPEKAVMFTRSATGGNVRVRPGSPGRWAVGLLQPLFPDRLSRAEVAGADLTGFADPAGGRVSAVVPGPVEQGLSVRVTCVRGVRLELTVAGRELGVARCEDAAVDVYGNVSLTVRAPALRELGLRPGGPVTVDVRSTGRRTAEWAVTVGR
jgi:hypothetical protein